MLRNNPQYRYLFGPVSISNNYPVAAKDLLVCFYSHYFGSERPPATAMLPYQVDPQQKEKYSDAFSGDNYKADFKQMKRMLSDMGCAVPTLYKQYTEVCEEDGVVFSDFNIDPEFSDCIDGFVIVDIDRLKPNKRKRYIDS